MFDVIDVSDTELIQASLTRLVCKLKEEVRQVLTLILMDFFRIVQLAR